MTAPTSDSLYKYYNFLFINDCCFNVIRTPYLNVIRTEYYNVRYSITLNDMQLDYLSDQYQDINRMKCFKTLVRLASMEQTTVSMKNFSAGMSIGQFAVSKVELARLWNCDRKTATRIIREFNDMDIITSVANNRTTIHTLNCISIWFTSSGCIRNPHFRSNPKVKVKTKEPKPIKKPPRVPPENVVTAKSPNPKSEES